MKWIVAMVLLIGLAGCGHEATSSCSGGQCQRRSCANGQCPASTVDLQPPPATFGDK